jgi:serine/threonine protein kinase
LNSGKGKKKKEPKRKALTSVRMSAWGRPEVPILTSPTTRSTDTSLAADVVENATNAVIGVIVVFVVLGLLATAYIVMQCRSANRVAAQRPASAAGAGAGAGAAGAAGAVVVVVDPEEASGTDAMRPAQHLEPLLMPIGVRTHASSRRRSVSPRAALMADALRRQASLTVLDAPRATAGVVDGAPSATTQHVNLRSVDVFGSFRSCDDAVAEPAVVAELPERSLSGRSSTPTAAGSAQVAALGANGRATPAAVGGAFVFVPISVGSHVHTLSSSNSSSSAEKHSSGRDEDDGIGSSSSSSEPELRSFRRAEPGARATGGGGLPRSLTDNRLSKTAAEARRSGEFGTNDDLSDDFNPHASLSDVKSPRLQRRQSLPRSLLAYAQASAALHEERARTVFSPEHRGSVDLANRAATAVDAVRRRPSVYTNDGGFSWDGTQSILLQLAELKKKNLEIERSRIALLEEVGHGAFARVYMASYDAPGTDLAEIVAVKQLLVESSVVSSPERAKPPSAEFDSERRVFMHEMELMRKLTPHENVVQLIGVVLSHPQWIVTEFCAGGALLGYLRDLRARDMRLGRRQTIEMMLQTACGVQHLHQQHIVHRDIAARNMLLAHNGVIKVADFGLSRNTLEDGYHTKSRTGPIRWMAVESMVGKAYSAASDIWSFGVLMWEIETRGLTPYFHIRNQIDLVMQIVRDKARLPAPAGCPLVLVQLMNRCWNELPHGRPDMSSIVTLLRQLKEEYHNDYIEADAKQQQSLETNSTIDSFAIAPKRAYDEIAGPNAAVAAAAAAAARSQLVQNLTQQDESSTYYFDEILNAQLDRLRTTTSIGTQSSTGTRALETRKEHVDSAAVARNLAAMFLQKSGNGAAEHASDAEASSDDDDDGGDDESSIVAPKRIGDEFMAIEH